MKLKIPTWLKALIIAGLGQNGKDLIAIAEGDYSAAIKALRTGDVTGFVVGAIASTPPDVRADLVTKLQAAIGKVATSMKLPPIATAVIESAVVTGVPATS